MFRSDEEARAENQRLSKRADEVIESIKADMACKLSVAGYDAKWDGLLYVGEIHVHTRFQQYGKAQWMREKSQTTRDGDPIVQGTIGYGYNKVTTRTLKDGTFDADKLVNAVIERVKSEKYGIALRKKHGQWKRETLRLLKSLGIEVDRYDGARIGPARIEVSNTGSVSVSMTFQHHDPEQIKKAIGLIKSLGDTLAGDPNE